MHTFDSIAHDLQEIGVKKGGTYFLRISYKAIGQIEGGPKTFLDAMLNVIGPTGTIIMTAFPPKHITQLRLFYGNHVYSKENFPKPVTGIIPYFAMKFPEAKLSMKLEFPFVVIGQHAKYLTENHTHEKSPYWLLREAMNKFDCECLRIGGKPLLGSVHMALEDVFDANNYSISKLRYGLYLNENGTKKWFDSSNIVFCYNAYFNFTDRIIGASKVNSGIVGDGKGVITNMKKSYEEEIKIYSEDIHNLLCDDPNCLMCRTSFSFSDSNNGQFFLCQIKRVFSKDYKKALSQIYHIILKILFEKRSTNRE